MEHNNKHKAQYRHISGANTAVMFIHGILGSPSQFDFLEQAAHERGFSTVSLLLPGHGGSAKAFAKSNPRLWKAYVDAEVKRVLDEEQYSRIFLVGHSMGGLLSLNAVKSARERISGLFLIALPLHARLGYMSIRTSLLTVFGRGQSDEYVVAAEGARSVGNCSMLTYITWLPNFIRLLLFSRKTRNALSSVSTRACLLFGAKDELVSKRSIASAKHLSNHSIYVLPNSSHYIYRGDDKETILKRFHQFLDV